MNNGRSEPSHWAILIGVNFYGSAADPLHGCVRDVHSIEQYLRSRNIDMVEVFTASSPSDNTSRLPYEDAHLWPTYENITASLKRVKDNAKPGDFVYIHFSGHGSQTAATSAKFSHKPTGDLALVLFEEVKGIRYLKGVDLALRLEEMVKKSLHVTLVLDCCFSGSVVRDGIYTAATVRGIDYDSAIDAAHPLHIDIEARYQDKLGPLRDARSLSTYLIDPTGFTVLSACAPHEIAEEVYLNSKERTGALSHFLLRALKSLHGTKITTQSLYHHLRLKFHVYWPKQVPMHYGREGVSFFGISPLDAGIGFTTALSRSEDNRLYLDAGLAHGVCKHDEYALYPLSPLEGKLHGLDQPSFHASVLNVGELKSELVQMNTRSNEKLAETRWRAKPLTHLSIWKAPVRRIYADDDDNAQWLASAKGKRFVQFIAEDIEEQQEQPYLFNVSLTKDYDYQILDASCDSIPTLPAIPRSKKDGLNRVFNMLEHLATYKYVEAIENRILNTNFEQSFTISFKDEVGNSHDAGAVLAVKHNETVTLTVENLGANALYLAILDLGPQWQINDLLSGEDGEEFRVVTPKKAEDANGRKGPEHTGKQTVPIQMTLPKTLRSQGHLQCEDIFKVFITSKPTSFTSLQLPKIFGSADSMDGPDRGESDYHELSTFLSALASPSRGSIANLPDEKWTTRTFVVRTIDENWDEEE